MACGKWTRLWPLSTGSKPKQFISLWDKTLINHTQVRFSSLNPITYYSILEDQIDNLNSSLTNKPKKENILFWDPKAKENAINILLSLKSLINKGISLDTSIIMTWSDIYIDENDKFLDSTKKALSFIEDNPKHILLFGIKPDTPSTSFWYIETEKNSIVSPVVSFKEKPDINLAQEYFKKWNYLWNSWVFAFKLWTIWNEILELLDIENWALDISKIPDIPIDKLIFEKSNKLSCIKLENIWWSDVWSFKSFHELSLKLNNQKWTNYLAENDSKMHTINSNWNFISTSSSDIILCWVNDLVIIEKKWKIYVMNKNDSKSIKVAESEID